jgi:hypothetical protein
VFVLAFQDSFLDIGWPLMSHLFVDKTGDDKTGDDGSKADGDLEDYDYDHEKDDSDGRDE